MKKRRFTKRVILSTLGLSLTALLLFGVFRRSSIITDGNDRTYNFFTMVKYGLLDRPIESLSQWSQDISTLWRVRDENDALRKELALSNRDRIKMIELENELHELKELQKLTKHYAEYDVVSGQVLTRQRDSWSSTVVINKGESDGVSVNDGVMAPDGIIGRVIHVEKHQSTVRLITGNDNYSQVSLKIQLPDATFVQAILKQYNVDDNTFSLDILDSGKQLKEGLLVTTAGVGGIYPSGLAMGEVHTVDPIASGVGVSVTVKSHVNFNSLRYIMVVKAQ